MASLSLSLSLSLSSPPGESLIKIVMSCDYSTEKELKKNTKKKKKKEEEKRPCISLKDGNKTFFLLFFENAQTTDSTAEEGIFLEMFRIIQREDEDEAPNLYKS